MLQAMAFTQLPELMTRFFTRKRALDGRSPTVCNGLRFQPVDATHSLNFSAGE